MGPGYQKSYVVKSIALGETAPVAPPPTPPRCVAQNMLLHLSKPLSSVVTWEHDLPACDDPRKALSIVLGKCQVS